MLCLNAAVLCQRPTYLSRVKETQIIPEGPAWPSRAEDYPQSQPSQSPVRKQTLGDITRESMSDLNQLELGNANRGFYPSRPPFFNVFDYDGRYDDYTPHYKYK